MSLSLVSPESSKVQWIVDRVAPTELTVLITGEPGVGKGSIARSIFEKSGRRHLPFYRIDCAGMKSGVVSQRAWGLPQDPVTALAGAEPPSRLAGGTLFLNEVSSLSSAARLDLIELIQQKNRVGKGTNGLEAVDVRIIAATTRDVREEGSFAAVVCLQRDVVHLEIPPLRKRPEDIPMLAEHFVRKFSVCSGGTIPASFTLDEWRVLTEYQWPGNIKELKSFIRRLARAENRALAFESLHRRMDLRHLEGGRKLSLLEWRRIAESQVERRVITKVLEQTGWNRKKAAQKLQISYRSLLSKIKKLEIG